jgi:hypothetical protein
LENLWRAYRTLKGADPQDNVTEPPEHAGRYLFDPSTRSIDISFFVMFLLRNPSLFPYSSSRPPPSPELSSEDDEPESAGERGSKSAPNEEPLVPRGDEEIAAPAPRELTRPSAEDYLHGLKWAMNMYLDFRYTIADPGLRCVLSVH